MDLEYEEIEALIDSVADDYKSFSEILAERGLSEEKAVGMALDFKKKYFDALCDKGLDKLDIGDLCHEVSGLLEKDKSDGMIFIYTALLTEKGLLYGECADREQLVSLWLEQVDKTAVITKYITRERSFRRKLASLANHKPNNKVTDIDREEQALLFNSVTAFPFLYKARNSNIFLDNLGELVRLVNSDELYRTVKPFIYFAVLTRKHKLITEREHFSPNIPAIFQYQHYKIDSDNGKNFNNYQAYLELYGTLKQFDDSNIDLELTDYCMANLSNLSEWFYENCEPNDDIPMTLRQIIDCLSSVIWLAGDVPDITEFAEDNPVLDIAYHNALRNEDFIDEIARSSQNEKTIEALALVLYEKANADNKCKDKKSALTYAKLCIYDVIEENNRKILVDAAKHFTENGYRKKIFR